MNKLESPLVSQAFSNRDNCLAKCLRDNDLLSDASACDE